VIARTVELGVAGNLDFTVCNVKGEPPAAEELEARLRELGRT